MSVKWMPQVATAVPGGGAHLAPDPVRELSLSEEVEAWLRSERRPSAPVMWCPRGTAETAIRGADALAAKIATLADEGEWAVARRVHGRTWAQCMRVAGGWIVEVNGIPGPDCFARRVRSMLVRHGMLSRRRHVRDRGRLMAIYERADVVRSAEAAGAIMWSWLRGGLPDGYTLHPIRA